jgi:hypothetical protein
VAHYAHLIVAVRNDGGIVVKDANTGQPRTMRLALSDVGGSGRLGITIVGDP